MREAHGDVAIGTVFGRKHGGRMPYVTRALPVTADLSNHQQCPHKAWWRFSRDLLTPPHINILHLCGFYPSPELSGMMLSIRPGELPRFCVYFTTQPNFHMNRYLGTSKISIIGKDFFQVH